MLFYPLPHPAKTANLCSFEDAVENLCVYANSSEFITIPAKISPQASLAQEPILEAGRKIIDSSCSVIRSAKSLIVMPRDPPTWQQFASHSKTVSDSIKKLVSSIRLVTLLLIFYLVRLICEF